MLRESEHDDTICFCHVKDLYCDVAIMIVEKEQYWLFDTAVTVSNEMLHPLAKILTRHSSTLMSHSYGSRRPIFCHEFPKIDTWEYHERRNSVSHCIYASTQCD